MIYRCAYTYRSSTDFTPQLEAHQRLVRCARLNCRLKHLLLHTHGPTTHTVQTKTKAGGRLVQPAKSSGSTYLPVRLPGQRE